MPIHVAPNPASGDDQKAAPTAVTQPWRRLTPARPRTWRAALLLAASCLVIGVKVVSTAVILYLSYMHVVMYAAEPVLMDTVMAESPLPALTLCPRRPPAAVYNASLAALRAGNISTGEFVRRLRPDPARLLRACTICDITAEHVTAVRVHHWFLDDDETLLPHCVTVQPRPKPLSEQTRDSERKAWLEVAVEPAPDGRWTHRLLIHPADRDATMPGSVYRTYEPPSSDSLIRPGTHVALSLAMKGRERVSRRGAPCGITTQRQQRSCIQQVLAEAAGCRAVWMDAPEVNSRPLCPLGSQAALHEEQLRSDWQQRVGVRCGGPTNCRSQLVTLAAVPRVRQLSSRPDTIRLRVSWLPLMSVTRERLALTGGDVASFVGGLVGLFSGLSVFSVLDAALAALHSLFNAQRRHPGDTQ